MPIFCGYVLIKNLQCWVSIIPNTKKESSTSNAFLRQTFGNAFIFSPHLSWSDWIVLVRIDRARLSSLCIFSSFHHVWYIWNPFFSIPAQIKHTFALTLCITTWLFPCNPRHILQREKSNNHPSSYTKMFLIPSILPLPLLHLLPLPILPLTPLHLYRSTTQPTLIHLSNGTCTIFWI